MRLLAAIAILNFSLAYAIYVGDDSYEDDCHSPDTTEKRIMCNLKPHIEDAIQKATKKIIKFTRKEISQQMEEQTQMLRRIGSLVQGKPSKRPTHCHNDQDGYTEIYPESCGIKETVFCHTKRFYGPTRTLVFERRFDQDDDEIYSRTWLDYKNGFKGTFTYWAGLEVIHQLTRNGNYSLQVEGGIEDINWGIAHYDHFRILGEEQSYALEIGDYIQSGMTDSLSQYNGNKFSTIDNDNDNSEINCAARRRGGWWFGRSCGPLSLTGPNSNLRYVEGTGWPEWSDSSDIRMKEIHLYILPREHIPFSRNCYGPYGNLDYFEFERDP